MVSLFWTHLIESYCNCIPRRKCGIQCICYRYASTIANTQISCVRSSPCSSCLIFLKFRSYIPCTKVTVPINLGTLQFHLWPLGGPSAFFFVHSRDQSFQPISFIFTPNMNQTKVKMPINFCHLVVPFLATRGPNSCFLCSL